MTTVHMDENYYGDDSPLHLPVGGLWCDVGAGVGAFRLESPLAEAEPHTRATILQGWIRGMERALEQAVLDLYLHMLRTRPAEAAPLDVDSFRDECQALGLSVTDALIAKLRRPLGAV